MASRARESRREKHDNTKTQATGACYEARCEEKLAAESACTSASGENFWCDDGATSVPTVVPTTAPTASCVEPDAFLPDPVDCSQSSMYDNITAGIFDCARRRPFASTA